MRSINKIIIHHSASGSAVTTVERINQWHLDRGWSGIGYHFVIYPDGTAHKGRSLAKKGAHCKGHNNDSIGICVAGNFEAEPFTAKQESGLFGKIEELLERYALSWNDVYYHQEFSKTACPGAALIKRLKSHREEKTRQS